VVVTATASGQAGPLAHTEARALIEPFYDLFRSDRRDWDRGFAVLADDWRSYYTNDLFRTKAETRPYIEGLFEIVPDMNVQIRQLAVDGPVITVRSELSGTPVKDFMVPYSGKSFSIMTIDLHQVGPDGRIATLHHLEDWGTATTQLGGARP
jgi:predicted ester cyclase